MTFHRANPWITALVFVAGAMACGPVPGAAPSGPGETAAEAPHYGGVFAYAGQTMGQSLNPHRFGSVSERYVPGPVFETLIHYKGGISEDHRIDFPVEPWLAERWEQPNETTYVFSTRKGVRWHDGVEFTAEDVAYTYTALLDRRNNYPLRSRLDGVAEVKALDKYTVQISTEGPLPDLLAGLADFGMMIMPKHLPDRGEDLDKVAVGTGPMKLKSYDRQKGATWVRNPEYWREGQPYAGAMEFHLIPEPGTRTAALVAAKVDIRAPTDRAQVDDLRVRIPNLQVAATPTDYGNSLIMKLDRPPFNDRRVRRAMHLAVDRQTLVQVASFGEGVVSLPGMPSNKAGWALPQEEWQKLPGFRQPKEQDLAEAKRLLAEAGYPNGLKVKVLFPSSKSATPKIVEPFASQLGVTGLFDLALEGRPQTDVLQFTREGNFEALFDGVANMSLNNQRNYLHSKGIYNKYGLNDPRIDNALDTINRSLDLNKRKAAAQEMQRVLLEESYVIPTIDLPGYQVWHPWVKNYRYNRGIAEIVDARAIAELWLDTDQMPADRRKAQ